MSDYIWFFVSAVEINIIQNIIHPVISGQECYAKTQREQRRKVLIRILLGVFAPWRLCVKPARLGSFTRGAGLHSSGFLRWRRIDSSRLPRSQICAAADPSLHLLTEKRIRMTRLDCAYLIQPLSQVARNFKLGKAQVIFELCRL